MITPKSVKLWSGIAILALCGSASVKADVTRNLVCLASGNWNDQGIRTSGNYQIGYSTEHPHHQAAYYLFDYSSIKGKKVTNLTITIPGSTDFNITDQWAGHHGGLPLRSFKVRIADQGPNSAAEITTGNNNPLLYTNAADEFRNAQMGYAWVGDGLHRGQVFDAFHFQRPGTADFDGVTFQTKVNEGGRHVIWACDAFDFLAGAENYIWGSTNFTTGIVLHVTTTN